MRREEHFAISPSRPKVFFLASSLFPCRNHHEIFTFIASFKFTADIWNAKINGRRWERKSYSESSHRIWVTFTLATLTEWKTKNPIARSSVIHLHLTRFISMLKIFYITFPEGEYLRNEMLRKLCPVSLCYL